MLRGREGKEAFWLGFGWVEDAERWDRSPRLWPWGGLCPLEGATGAQTSPCRVPRSWGAGGGDFWELRGRGGGRGSDSEALWGSVVLLSWFCCDLAPRGFRAVWEGRCRRAGRPTGTFWGRGFGPCRFPQLHPTGGSWSVPRVPRGPSIPRAVSATGKIRLKRGFSAGLRAPNSHPTGAQNERQTRSGCCCFTPRSPGILLPGRGVWRKNQARAALLGVFSFFFFFANFLLYCLFRCRNPADSPSSWCSPCRPAPSGSAFHPFAASYFLLRRKIGSLTTKKAYQKNPSNPLSAETSGFPQLPL